MNRQGGYEKLSMTLTLCCGDRPSPLIGGSSIPHDAFVAQRLPLVSQPPYFVAYFPLALCYELRKQMFSTVSGFKGQNVTIKKKDMDLHVCVSVGVCLARGWCCSALLRFIKINGLCLTSIIMVNMHSSLVCFCAMSVWCIKYLTVVLIIAGLILMLCQQQGLGLIPLSIPDIHYKGYTNISSSGCFFANHVIILSTLSVNLCA